jgi:hypothetical protein
MVYQKIIEFGFKDVAKPFKIPELKIDSSRMNGFAFKLNIEDYKQIQSSQAQNIFIYLNQKQTYVEILRITETSYNSPEIERMKFSVTEDTITILLNALIN